MHIKPKGVTCMVAPTLSDIQVHSGLCFALSRSHEYNLVLYGC